MNRHVTIAAKTCTLFKHITKQLLLEFHKYVSQDITLSHFQCFLLVKMVND
jgi:hypothetical protein